MSTLLDVGTYSRKKYLVYVLVSEGTVWALLNGKLTMFSH